jgi:hypothetical protein
MAKVSTLENIHPGEVLPEEFPVPMGLSQNRIAREIGVQPLRTYMCSSTTSPSSTGCSGPVC